MKLSGTVPTTDMPDSQKPPARKRLGVPVIISAISIGLVTALLLWATVRGNWTDSQRRNPASPADGVVTQLLRTTDGHKRIRAAILVSGPTERAWKVVTDYDHFSDVFPNFGASKGVRDADGRWHLTGEVQSLVGHWPVDVHVTHQELPGKFTASWDEPYGSLKINRGSWVVSEHGPNESLLEYNLEVRVSPFPDFVVRCVMLDQLKPVIRAVANHVRQEQQPR